MAQHKTVVLSQVSAGAFSVAKRLPLPHHGTLEGFYFSAGGITTATQYEVELYYGWLSGAVKIVTQQIMAHNVPAVANSWSDSTTPAQASTWTNDPVRHDLGTSGLFSALWSDGALRTSAGVWARAKIISGIGAGSGNFNMGIRYDMGPNKE